MNEAVIAARKPILISTEAGKSYFWCSCGRSKNQPFCDGSHKGTGFEPLKWTAPDAGERLFCVCKHTGTAPFCDGSHNSLSDKYAEAQPGDGAAARLVDYQPAEGGASKALLDNGCYVIRVPESALERHGALGLFPVIGARDGARHLSQYLAIVTPGETPVLRYPGSDVALFVISGQGSLAIDGREFALAPETGACVKPGEGFRLQASGPTRPRRRSSRVTRSSCRANSTTRWNAPSRRACAWSGFSIRRCRRQLITEGLAPAPRRRSL